MVNAILLALALSDGDFPTAEVEVLDAQLEAFEESQPRTVQERADQARGTVPLGQDCLDLVVGSTTGSRFGLRARTTPSMRLSGCSSTCS